MGIVFRQSIKSTIIHFAGALLGALIVYLSARFLGTDRYGINKTIINIGAVAQIFVSLGSANTYYIVNQRYDDQPEKKHVLFSICLMIPFVMMSLFCIPYFICQKQVIDLYQVKDRFYIATFYLYVPLLVWIWGTTQLLEQYLWSQVKVAVTAFFREIVLRLINILLLILFILNFISFYTFIVSIVLSYFIPFVGLALIIIRNGNFHFSLNWKVFSKDEYKELFRFSWYHMLLGLSLNLMGYIDSLMIGPLAGLSYVAVYTTAVYIVALINLPFRSMASASVASLNAAFLANDMPKLKDLFQRSSINIFIVALGITAVIVCNLANVPRVLSGDYADIIPITLILLIGRLVDMATGLNTELMSISQYYKVSFRISMALIIMLILFYSALIPKYGIYGAAWGSTLALVIFNALKIYFLWRRLGVEPFSKHSLTALLACIIACIPAYFIPLFANPYLDTIIRSAVVAFIYVLGLLLLKPSADFNSFLKSAISNRKFFN